MQFHQIAKNDPCSNYWLSINFWDINLIFDSGKSWDCIFWDGKVFYPIKKFFTPLLTSWKSEKLKNLKIRFVASSVQKGGKKLSEGVKNFFMIKSNVPAFSWTKNHTFIVIFPRRRPFTDFIIELFFLTLPLLEPPAWYSLYTQNLAQFLQQSLVDLKEDFY